MKKFTRMGRKRHEEDNHQRNREERKKRGEVRQVKAMICIDEGRNMVTWIQWPVQKTREGFSKGSEGKSGEKNRATTNCN